MYLIVLFLMFERKIGYTAIEKGRKTPSIETLNKYADYFDTSVSSIMFFSEDLDKENRDSLKVSARKKLVKFLKIMENATEV